MRTSGAAAENRSRRILENVLTGLCPEKLSQRAMFGAMGYFISGNIVAFVMKSGEVGLKVLPEPLAAEIGGRKGVTPFQPGGSTPMKKWWVIPETATQWDDFEDLVERAGLAIRKLPPKEPKTRRQSVSQGQSSSRRSRAGRSSSRLKT